MFKYFKSACTYLFLYASDLLAGQRFSNTFNLKLLPDSSATKVFVVVIAYFFLHCATVVLSVVVIAFTAKISHLVYVFLLQKSS